MSRGTHGPAGVAILFAYETVTPYGGAFQRLRLSITFPPQAAATAPAGRTTPVKQRLRAFTFYRFGLFPVRSPLLGESLLISLPRGT